MQSYKDYPTPIDVAETQSDEKTCRKVRRRKHGKNRTSLQVMGDSRISFIVVLRRWENFLSAIY